MSLWSMKDDCDSLARIVSTSNSKRDSFELGRLKTFRSAVLKLSRSTIAWLPSVSVTSGSVLLLLTDLASLVRSDSGPKASYQGDQAKFGRQSSAPATLPYVYPGDNVH